MEKEKHQKIKRSNNGEKNHRTLRWIFRIFRESNSLTSNVPLPMEESKGPMMPPPCTTMDLGMKSNWLIVSLVECAPLSDPRKVGSQFEYVLMGTGEIPNMLTLPIGSPGEVIGKIGRKHE